MTTRDGLRASGSVGRDGEKLAARLETSYTAFMARWPKKWLGVHLSVFEFGGLAEDIIGPARAWLELS